MYFLLGAFLIICGLVQLISTVHGLRSGHIDSDIGSMIEYEKTDEPFWFRWAVIWRLAAGVFFILLGILAFSR